MHSEFVSSVTYKGHVIAIDRFGDAWMFSTEPPDHVVTVRKLLVGAGSMRVAMRAFDQWQA